MEAAASIVNSEVFLRLMQFIGALALLAALGGTGFILYQITRTVRPAGGDPNWRFLFSCWADSVAIIILYASLNFVWLYDRFVQILLSASYFTNAIAQMFTSQYVMLVLEALIYALIMIVAVRLFLRIRRLLEQS